MLTQRRKGGKVKTVKRVTRLNGRKGWLEGKAGGEGGKTHAKSGKDAKTGRKISGTTWKSSLPRASRFTFVTGIEMGLPARCRQH